MEAGPRPVRATFTYHPRDVRHTVPDPALLRPWTPTEARHPDGVLVWVRLEGPPPGGALHPDEAARAATWHPKRQATWTGGRLALRAALRACGVAADDPLLPDDRGAPRLPPGVAASLSHTGDLAVALAAPAAGFRLGIDIERLAPARLNVVDFVLTDAEKALFDALPEDDRWPSLLLRFSVKEAIYKVLDPSLRRWIGFEEVEIPAPPLPPPPGDPPAAVVVARLPADAPGVRVEATCALGPLHLLSTARAAKF
jgi:4'-phosphopantetheinyl transferase EntD